MNKGVEILLERRKTNPEEFRGRLDRFERSRWNALLRNFQVDLDQPNTYPLGEPGEIFAREVMDRVLTARDLLPSGLLTAAAITEQSLKILENEFTKVYSSYTNEHAEAFK
jgi:hypothetical protein